MIERFYLKDFLSFAHAQLEFKQGLVVFSGPSGSGKSILMEAILSSFGLASCDASLCESSVTWEIDDSTGIENEEVNVFKQVKKEKSRYFINAQSVPKKVISSIASKHLRHLSLRDYSDFENRSLLEILDERIALRHPDIKEKKERLAQLFFDLAEVARELQTIQDEQKRIVELKEFAKFEIEKISAVDPKEGEYEELLKIKKELSKKEKVFEAIERAYRLFEAEHHVNEALELLEEESTFFDDAMNELRAKLESASERFAALEEMDVEEVLDRLESLSELKRKYGSIAEALEYREKKLKELEKYENIEFEKSALQQRHTEIESELASLAEELSILRKEELPSFEQDLNDFTAQLYLQEVSVLLQESAISSLGKDSVALELKGVGLQKISTGEFNRLRLAVLALKSEFLAEEGGVLMLDEIDANLSGEESMSVARVLRRLSKKYQIFVISHQPQLTSQGEQHFFVYKESDGTSHVKELDSKERVDEIARIISGDKISPEAVSFARELLKSAK